jgi:hypothetical protein
MSMPLIKAEVATMLSQVNEQITNAEAKLADGSDRQKVDAVGELTVLKHQKETVEGRLREIQARPDATETMFQWIKEEVFNLKLRLEIWIGGA